MTIILNKNSKIWKLYLKNGKKLKNKFKIMKTIILKKKKKSLQIAK